MNIVPIGIDCRITDLLRNNRYRKKAYPFGWCLTFNGITEIVSDKFCKFDNIDNKLNRKYNIGLPHYLGPEVNDKLKIRCDRFMKLLIGNEPVVFIRKGHSCHHHKESNQFNFNLKCDIQDMIEFSKLLKKDYKNLNYKIILILGCDKCYNPNIDYNDINNEDITIYNLALPKMDHEKFNDKFNEIKKTFFLDL